MEPVTLMEPIIRCVLRRSSKGENMKKKRRSDVEQRWGLRQARDLKTVLTTLAVVLLFSIFGNAQVGIGPLWAEHPFPRDDRWAARNSELVIGRSFMMTIPIRTSNTDRELRKLVRFTGSEMIEKGTTGTRVWPIVWEDKEGKTPFFSIVGLHNVFALEQKNRWLMTNDARTFGVRLEGKPRFSIHKIRHKFADDNMVLVDHGRGRGRGRGLVACLRPLEGEDLLRFAKYIDDGYASYLQRAAESAAASKSEPLPSLNCVEYPLGDVIESIYHGDFSTFGIAADGTVDKTIGLQGRMSISLVVKMLLRTYHLCYFELFGFSESARAASGEEWVPMQTVVTTKDSWGNRIRSDQKLGSVMYVQADCANEFRRFQLTEADGFAQLALGSPRATASTFMRFLRDYRNQHRPTIEHFEANLLRLVNGKKGVAIPRPKLGERMVTMSFPWEPAAAPVAMNFEELGMSFRVPASWERLPEMWRRDPKDMDNPFPMRFGLGQLSSRGWTNGGDVTVGLMPTPREGLESFVKEQIVRRNSYIEKYYGKKFVIPYGKMNIERSFINKRPLVFYRQRGAAYAYVEDGTYTIWLDLTSTLSVEETDDFVRQLRGFTSTIEFSKPYKPGPPPVARQKPRDQGAASVRPRSRRGRGPRSRAKPQARRKDGVSNSSIKKATPVKKKVVKPKSQRNSKKKGGFSGLRDALKRLPKRPTIPWPR